MNQNPYESLGIKQSATQDEIKNAYRNLAKKLHPDLNPGNPEAEKKFKIVNAAYEAIGTPEAKSKFDRGESDAQNESQYRRGSEGATYHHQTQGQDFGNRGRYSQAFSGMDDDLFSSIFGSKKEAPPLDENYLMEIEFKDSILGLEKEFTLPNGNRIKVKIPAGIESGKKLRFSGLANPISGKGSGDVYVEIKVGPSHLFRREGNHVEIEIPISAIESLLGAEIEVPTLEASVVLKVPAFVSSGQKLRLQGKGVPGKGDQLVKLKIVNPKLQNQKLGEDLSRKLSEWNEQNPFQPREERSL